MVNGWLSWVRNNDKAILSVLEEQAATLLKATSGAIMGVGATTRLSAVRWGIGKRLVYAWIITIPASALVAGLILYIIRLLS